MNNINGALAFDSTINNSQFNAASQEMINRIRGVSASVVSEARTIDNAFAKLGQVAAGYFAFTQLSDLPSKIVKVRGEFQQLEIALNTMLGSKQKADSLLSQIVDTASSTPFGLKDLSSATKQLLAYGSASENVIGEIRMLGDVASGVSTPINELVYLYGTLRSQGRAYSVDIRQFAGRGIPIYRELAKVLDVDVSKVNDLIEAGKVGFPQVEQAFRSMTATGGMFGGLMEAQSKSLTGLTERLSDAVDVMFNSIGKSQEGFASEALIGAAGVVENYREVSSALVSLVAVYGSYRAALALVNALQTTSATTYAGIAANIDKSSGSYAREIALKTKSAQASELRAQAAAGEAFALSLNASAQVQTLRAEVIAAAAKRASAIESAKSAAAEISAAEVRLAAANANQIATAQYLSASVRNAAAKELEIAQNALLVASENGVVARKAASAASSDYLTKKTALETAAKEANSLVAATNATAITAGVAAQNAAAVSSTRLTAVQGLQIAVTRQLALAQAAFNASLLSNPIVLATVAIVALAGAMWYLSDGTTAAEVAQKSLNKTLADLEKKKENLVAKTQQLTSIINSESETVFAQSQAYAALLKLYPGLLDGMTMQQFKTLKLVDAQKLLNEARDQQSASNLDSGYDEALKKVSDLEKKLKALKDQQASSGVGAGGLNVPILETQKAYEAAKEEAQKLKDISDQTAKSMSDAKLPLEDQLKALKDLQSSLQDQRKAVEENISKTQKLGSAAQSIKPFFEQITLNSLNQQLDVITGKIKAMTTGAENEVKNKAYYEKLKESKTSEFDALGTDQQGSTRWKALRKDIKDAETQLDKYNLKEKKVAEKDKVQPFGSLAYWEQISRKAQEAMDKLNPKDISGIDKLRATKLNAEIKAGQTKAALMPYGSLEYWDQITKNAQDILKNAQKLSSGEIDEQKNIIVNAEQKSADIRKQVAIKTFDDELTEKKAKYELYQRWVSAYGETAAKEQFSSLVQQGTSYAAYLDSEIKKLEAQEKTPGVGLIAPEQERLVKLKFEYDDVTGAETPLEKFQKRLDNIRISAGSLTDEIEALKKVQAELNPLDTSPDARSKKKATSDQLEEATRARRADLVRYLQDVAGSEEQRLAIEKKYADLRNELYIKYGNNRSAAFQKSIADIDESERRDFQEQRDRISSQSKEFRALSNVIVGTGRDGIKERIKNEEAFLAVQKRVYGEGSQEYKKQLEVIKELNKDFADKGLQNFAVYASAVGALSDALSELPGTFGDLGSALSGLASGVNNFNVAMSRTKDGKLGVEQYGAAIQGVANLIGIVVNSAKERKLAEQEYYNSVINQQQQYNLLLNEQIGLQGKASSSIFYTDFEKQINAGYAQITDADKKFRESLKALEDGRAKDGQKNGVDWKKVGQGAASGAAIGAVAGGGVFSWATTAIGAVGGALVGLFGGLKKKDTYTPLLEAWPGLIDQSKDGMESFNAELAQTLIDNNLVDEATKRALQTTIEWKKQYIEAQEAIKGVIKDLAGALGDDLRNGLVTAFQDGTSAADAFGDSVSKILQNILEQMIFSKVLGPALDQLEADMNASMNGGDGSWIDDFGRFFSQAEALGNSYFDALTGAQAQAANYGIDIFKSTKDQGQTNALSGSIQGVSQDTANVLVGQINAIRITQADNNSVMRQHLIYQANISSNSNYLSLLVSIDKKLDKLNPPADNFNRAFGG